MTPLDLWIDGLENRYWQIYGSLRGPVNDPQICGDGFCALGVLCDLFIRHAPEAAQVKARWEQGAFVWEEPDGSVHKQTREPFVPAPVASWWGRFHAMGLRDLIWLNDKERRSFGELAMYLRGMAGRHYATK